jgi:hypothetical protein
MQEITIELNNTHSVGLGDNLCLISAMANLPPKVKLFVSNEHNTFDKLTQYTRIFRIPKSQLEIYQTDKNGTFDNTGWPVKSFTDYYKSPVVNVNGNVLSINKGQNKQFIAVVTAFQKDTSGRNEWPWCRNRPIEYWEKIFSWIRSIGYEVITLDEIYTNLETKIEILAKYCCAVISYEGGIAHLAHMMDIPCLLVDWKHPSPSTHLDVFHSDFVHRTNSVYILRNDDEIFTWDRTKFDVVTNSLREGKGNNRFESKDFTFNFIGPGFHNDLRIYNKNGTLCLQTQTFLGKHYADFLYKYYQNTLTPIG